MLKIISNFKRMNIHLISDIHTEFFISKAYKNDIDIFCNKLFKKKHNYSKKNILCLCGDIGYPELNNYKKFLKICNNNFDKTFVISGNHEYYNFDSDIKLINDADDQDKIIMMKIKSNPLSMSEKNNIIEEICNGLDNTYFLNNKMVKYENALFIGCTLWSKLESDDKMSTIGKINDFNKIITDDVNYMTFQNYRELHEKDVEFLKDVITKNKNEDIVILTHHLPSFKMIVPKYKEKLSNLYFASDLDNFIKDNPHIKLWLCGHTHHKIKQKIGSTTIIANPVGYPWENKN